jgi:glycosyltransferase involved in cell wall biosynthesis
MNPLINSHRKKLLQSQAVVISCIVPVHNEEALIADFIDALRAQLMEITHQSEIIVINDGSCDQTEVILTQLAIDQKIKLINFSRNFGKEQAIAAGLAHCSGDVGIIIDADFQHPIEVVPTFLEKWAEGFDMVYGLREDRLTDTRIKRFFTKIFYRLLSASTKVPIPPHAGDFRLLDKKVVDALNLCKERTRFTKGLYAWVGFSSIAVPFKVVERPAGKSSYRYRQLADLALTGLISFSDIPLRIWGLVGLLISGLSFVIALYIIFSTLIFGVDVPGYATILVTIIFFGGIQLLSIGFLGEYIARIFHEVKNRPPYIIKKSYGLDVKQE